jgi:HAMP domain-containing protein
MSLRAVAAVLALLLLVAGTAFATRSNLDRHTSPLTASNQPSDSGKGAGESEAPESEAPESPDTKANTNESDAGAQLSDAHAAELVDLLKAAGITATAAELKTLAAKYGVGGAVRLEAWADATGKTVTELGAMFDGGMGWGAIAHELEKADSSLHLSPGIGWIMGHGHGHGNAHAAKPTKGSAGSSS